MKRETIGACLMIGPFLGLLVTLPAYAIATFVISALATAETSGSGSVMIGQIVQIVFGLVGVVSVLGFFTLVPFGLYLVMSEPKKKGSKT